MTKSMGCCRNIAAIAIVSSNPKSWPGLQALVIHTLDSTMQRIGFWETRIALSTGGLSSGYCYPPFEHLGQAHFSLYFPISLPHSYSCSYSGSGPIPYSGFLLFQTSDLSSQTHNIDWLPLLSFRAFRMGRERQNGKTAKQNSITER